MVLLFPKDVKFPKVRKNRIRGLENRANSLKYGFFGLKALENGRITARQIEAARQAIAKKIKRKGKLWIRTFPSVAVSSKPNEVRMGKGKGAFSYWVCPVKSGKILYEIAISSPQIAKEALYAGSTKLPVLTKFVIKK